MREFLGKYPLKNRQTGKYTDADLFLEIAKNNIDDFDSKWKPQLQERKNNLKECETLESANIQDFHWDWSRKVDKVNKRLDYESFAVESDNTTQGLMLLNNVALARERKQKGRYIVYIEYLAVAPWNRFSFTDTPLFKGVGSLLLGTAINYSFDQEFDGRIGLHSLPQSEVWYREQCEMTDLGPDPDYPHNLRYYEMTPTQAKSFLNI